MQSYAFNLMEVILIDDGSTDSSASLCKYYKKSFDNIIFLQQRKKGVSAARNLGLKHASGKYIFFLDVDDIITSNTIEDCVCFFESVQNEVDLITYPIETIYQGKKLNPHFRYQFLRESGVFDLCSNAFIGQTTMNIVVKNKYLKNILFDENQTFAEDQRYCCEVLEDKLKMGFCSTACYIYNRSLESSSGKLAGACYIFEQSLSFFEEMFDKYEYVPMAFQGLFVNDIYWKIQNNIFFPYHYDNVNFDKSMQRVKRLLQKCYNSVILDHPAIDFYEKFYLMRLKGREYITNVIKKDEIALYSEGYLVLQEKRLEIVITKVSIRDNSVSFHGFLKSAFFQFYNDKPKLYATENEQEKRELSLVPSTHNYYLSHEPTQRFWRMEYVCNVQKVNKVAFHVVLGAAKLPVCYYFMPLTPFSSKYNYNVYKKHNIEVKKNIDNSWEFLYHNNIEQTKRIWLYYDCKGVAIDNGLQQYLHDCNKMDGVVRYYVVSDKRQEKYIPVYGNRVQFGSTLHRELVTRAEKIVTAYIENNNIFPFEPSEYEKYANKFYFETIYLQHGLLHIDMPWKYSPERIIADKVIISALHEVELFKKNGFKEENLWKIMMPRFDVLPLKARNLKKIVYAPSWRSYLVGDNIDNKWKIPIKKYITSNFFIGMQEFICSSKLDLLLEEYGYQLDIKLHPIFAECSDLIKISSNHISFKNEIVEDEYSLFITDFSSYMFDFIYMKVPIISFIPDFDELKCGMNGYRDIDFLNKVNENEIAKKPEDAVSKIRSFLETGKGINYQVKFFFDENNKLSKDLIYSRLMED